MRTAATAGRDGTTIRGTAVACPTPTATSPTGLTADGVVCARRNYQRTWGTSGRRVRKVGPTGSRGIPAQTYREDVAGQASYPRRGAPTDPADVAARASFPRTLAPTDRVQDRQVAPGHRHRWARRTGVVQAASGVDGADPKRPWLTGEVRSEEAAPGRPVNSATAEPVVWAAEAFAGAAAPVEAAGADGDQSE